MRIPLIVGGAIVTALYLLLRERHPKVFISFAAEDDIYRTYLVGQAKNDKVPFKFVDKSLHEPFSNAWKTQTREIIRDCDALVLMIGSNTYRSDGAIWEVDTALAEAVPVFAIHINKAPKGRVPAIIKTNRIKVIPWKHDLIHRELGKLADRKKNA